MNTSIFIVDGMDCAEEEGLIRKKLSGMDGIGGLRFNLIARKLYVTHSLNDAQILDTLTELGFRARLEGIEIHPSFWQRNRQLILTIVSGVFAGSAEIVAWTTGEQNLFVLFLCVPAILAGGFRIAIRGWKAARTLSLDMNFLMTIAVIGAVSIGEWTEGAMVIFLFAVANLLEGYSLDRARNAIRGLMALAPQTALVKRDGAMSELDVEDIMLGDTMIIRPGERIPLDGTVIAGESFVNQAPITGESIPAAKNSNDAVYAGTINGLGTLEARVTALSGDTTIARIIRLIDEAQSRRAPSQRFVDSFARYYTPAVVGIAFLMAVLPTLIFSLPFHEWFYKALTLLVIACPCALVISTPVTIVSGLAVAARLGILIKGGAYLEQARSLKAIAFDKTGTLTHGKPSITDIVTFGETNGDAVLSIAASVEARSEHPIATAILEAGKARGVRLSDITRFQAVGGRGILASINGRTYLVGSHRFIEDQGTCSPEVERALADLEVQGKTTVVVSDADRTLGIIAVTDALRGSSLEATKELARMGIHCVMLTGDNRGTAASIAGQLNITDVRSELLPEMKSEIVEELVQVYGTVAMVGDGINDAPALAVASIGVAMGAAGSDTALETADVALMSDDLTRLPLLIRMSKKTARVLAQNISLALGIKAAFLVLVALGSATLWLAVFADMGASLIVALNGLRMLRFSER